MTRDTIDEGDGPDAFEHVDSIEAIDANQWVQVNQAHYDTDDEVELATAFAFAVAEAAGIDPVDHTAMPPLYEYIDAQSLDDAFFGPRDAGSGDGTSGAVTFVYSGYKVALRGDGWIFVYEPR